MKVRVDWRGLRRFYLRALAYSLVYLALMVAFFLAAGWYFSGFQSVIRMLTDEVYVLVFFATCYLICGLVIVHLSVLSALTEQFFRALWYLPIFSHWRPSPAARQGQISRDYPAISPPARPN